MPFAYIPFLQLTDRRMHQRFLHKQKKRAQLVEILSEGAFEYFILYSKAKYFLNLTYILN